MHFDLKPISKESIPRALEKAQLYRSLNEPGLAESICLDILAVLPEHQAALVSLLLARGAGGEALGCVALRPLASPGYCEMKRLYVAPEARGLGLGAALIAAVLAAAARAGYGEIWLDTLPSMTTAIAAYRALGFRPIAPYYNTAPAGTIFLGLALAGL